MALPSTIDVEALAQPISADNPAGDDPRSDGSAQSLYYRAKDGRSSARAAERANVDADAPPPEAWSTVLDSGVGLLSGQAKDLEVASWMTEALVRLEGFAGLRDGLRALGTLVDGFWDTVHPLPDEDGVEGRLTSVAALNGSGAAGTLAQPIRTLPIVGIGQPFSIWTYDQAVELEKMPNPAQKAARIAAGVLPMEKFRESLAETPARDLYDTLTTIEEAIAAVNALGASLDKAAGSDAPSFSALRELLEHIAGSIRYFGADKIAGQAKAAAPAPVPAAQAGSPAGAAAANGAASGSAPQLGGMARTGGFSDREEALAAVEQLADYFRRTEPQAPISYTLTEAVRRARMSLPELLQELTSDASHISQFILAAGMRAEGKSETTQARPAAAAAEAVVDDGWGSPKPKRSDDGW